MITFNLFEFYNRVQSEKILIEFKGALSQELLIEMGSLINEKYSEEKKIHKIFSVFIELAQNMMLYSSERQLIGDKDIGVGIILVIDDVDFYTVLSGNKVKNEDIQKITSKIDKINNATKEELSDMIKTQRRGKPPEGSKGAGIGLMEIVRKSGKSIVYQLHKVDDLHSFLVLMVSIEKEVKNG